MLMRTLAPLAVLLCLSGCNLYGGLDKPSGNDQLLAAARACFDQGDLECARSYYAQISGDQRDVATSETAFIMLKEAGASMAAYGEFVGGMIDQSAGYGMTKFAERLISGAGGAAGVSKRIAIWNAYAMRNSITDAQLKAYVRFVTATALAAELLAEATQGGAVLLKTHLASNATTCAAATSASCNATAGCGVPAGTGSNLTATAAADITTTSPTNTNPSLDQLYQAVSEAYQALNALDAGGKFARATAAFSAIQGVGQPSTSFLIDRCFRYQLLTNQIGE